MRSDFQHQAIRKPGFNKYFEARIIFSVKNCETNIPFSARIYVLRHIFFQQKLNLVLFISFSQRSRYFFTKYYHFAISCFLFKV